MIDICEVDCLTLRSVLSGLLTCESLLICSLTVSLFLAILLAVRVFVSWVILLSVLDGEDTLFADRSLVFDILFRLTTLLSEPVFDL